MGTTPRAGHGLGAGGATSLQMGSRCPSGLKSERDGGFGVGNPIAAGSSCLSYSQPVPHGAKGEKNSLDIYTAPIN